MADHWDGLLVSVSYALGGLTFLGFFVYHRIVVRLERYHRDIWLELGSPILIRNNKIRNSFLMWRFLLSNRSASMSDHVLLEFVWTMRVLSFLALAILFYATFADR